MPYKDPDVRGNGNKHIVSSEMRSAEDSVSVDGM